MRATAFRFETASPGQAGEWTIATQPAKRRRAISAGGVVLRRRAAGTEIVVCHRRAEGLWALPKGTPEAGESIEETALREVSEETGLQVALGPPVGETRYSFERGGYLYDKVVRFFLMTAVGGSVELHDGEYDEVEWTPAARAAGVLTFENESRIVEAALPLAEAPDAHQAAE